jgi:hypothetical protein
LTTLSLSLQDLGQLVVLVVEPFASKETLPMPTVASNPRFRTSVFLLSGTH